MSEDQPKTETSGFTTSEIVVGSPIAPTHDMRCAFALGRVLGAMDALKARSDQVGAQYGGASADAKALGELVDIAHSRTVDACEVAGFDTTLALAHEAAVRGNRTQ